MRHLRKCGGMRTPIFLTPRAGAPEHAQTFLASLGANGIRDIGASLPVQLVRSESLWDGDGITSGAAPCSFSRKGEFRRLNRVFPWS